MATTIPARLLGLDTYATRGVGGRADLVALDRVNLRRDRRLARRRARPTLGPDADRCAVRHLCGRPGRARGRRRRGPAARGRGLRPSSSRTPRPAAASPPATRVSRRRRRCSPATSSTCSSRTTRSSHPPDRASRWCTTGTTGCSTGRDAERARALAAQDLRALAVPRRRAGRDRSRDHGRRDRHRARRVPRSAQPRRRATRRAGCSKPPGRRSSRCPRAETCCGFGGTFSMEHGEIAAPLADDKLAHAATTGARWLVSGDAACLLHLEGRRRRTGVGPGARPPRPPPRRRSAGGGTVSHGVVTPGASHRGARRATRSRTPSCSGRCGTSTSASPPRADRRRPPPRAEGSGGGAPARDARRSRRAGSIARGDADRRWACTSTGPRRRRTRAGSCSRSPATRSVTRAVKSKSMATEEIDLVAALEAAGIEAVETDLGEYIVQVAGERPSHMITPAIHKTLGQIAACARDPRRRAASRRSARRSPPGPTTTCGPGSWPPTSASPA